MKKKNWTKLSVTTLLAVGTLLFASCLGIEMNIEVEKDGSGTAEMSFHISQIFFQMGPEAGDVPVPLSREELETSYEGVSGVKVVDVEETDNEEKKVIRAKIAYDNLEALTSGDGDLFEGTTLTRSGGRTVYRAVLKPAVDSEEAPSDPAQEEMVKPYFEGYYFEYNFTAPAKIRSHSLGTLSSDGRKVSYKMAMYDFNSMNNSEPLVLEVTW